MISVCEWRNTKARLCEVWRQDWQLMANTTQRLAQQMLWQQNTMLLQMIAYTSAVCANQIPAPCAWQLMSSPDIVCKHLGHVI